MKRKTRADSVTAAATSVKTTAKKINPPPKRTSKTKSAPKRATHVANPIYQTKPIRSKGHLFERSSSINTKSVNENIDNETTHEEVHQFHEPHDSTKSKHSDFFRSCFEYFPQLAAFNPLTSLAQIEVFTNWFNEIVELVLKQFNGQAAVLMIQNIIEQFIHQLTIELKSFQESTTSFMKSSIEKLSQHFLFS